MNSRQPGISKGLGRPVSKALDLGEQGNVSPQFQMLQGMHETYARSLSNVLSPFLQSEIQATLAGIRLTTIGDYQRALPNPTCLLTLRLHPEPERVLLCLDCATVLSLLDLLLGGSGSPQSASRELTEIEWSLLEEISRVIVRCLGESWQSVKPVEFVVESLGSDPSLTLYPDPTRSALLISFGLRLPEGTGHFEIAVPCSFFEATAPARGPQEAEDALSPVDIERNAHLLENAEVELEVHLDGARLTFGELMALQQGQVVRFDHAVHEPVRGIVNGELSFPGHILSSGRRRAFQLEEMSS